MKLPITSYLNQKIVFDLLAVIEDGFSQVRKLETTQDEAKTTNVSGQGEIGLSNVFSLLGVNLKAATGREKSQSDSAKTSEERIHTPTSLFAKLLSYLDENELIKYIDDTTEIEEIDTGSFVCFKGTLQQNPIVSLLNSIEQFGVMATRLDSQKGKQKSENQDILKQIKAMKDSLVQDEMLDLICSLATSNDLKAVLPVYLNYFFNRNMSDLIDGEYTVVGKVIRIVSADTEETINLLRNTSFNLFKQHAIEGLFEQMSRGQSEQFNMPDIATHIAGPSMLVIPIAIYS